MGLEQRATVPKRHNFQQQSIFEIITRNKTCCHRFSILIHPFSVAKESRHLSKRVSSFERFVTLVQTPNIVHIFHTVTHYHFNWKYQESFFLIWLLFEILNGSQETHSTWWWIQGVVSCLLPIHIEGLRWRISPFFFLFWNWLLDIVEQ